MEQGIAQETESACNVNARAGAGAKGPLRTHRCLAPSRLNSQFAESSPSYAGALSTLPATCAPRRAPPLRPQHAGGYAPAGGEGGRRKAIPKKDRSEEYE